MAAQYLRLALTRDYPPAHGVWNYLRNPELSPAQWFWVAQFSNLDRIGGGESQLEGKSYSEYKTSSEIFLDQI